MDKMTERYDITALASMQGSADTVCLEQNCSMAVNDELSKIGV